MSGMQTFSILKHEKRRDPAKDQSHAGCEENKNRPAS
jgi:hypothetical protein